MSAGAELAIAPYVERDEDELLAAFAAVVEEGGGYPQAPPVDREGFRAVWVEPAVSVQVARVGGELAGGYYLKPNFPGRAAHIANAGYLVVAGMRGRGIGEALVVHSLAEARRQGFDALMFNLVFESNPAGRLYERLGFRRIGLIPDAVEGESARIYWRSLSDQPAEGV
ncbi:MAG TPA: GNAT family N-acetyltransferase [Solirubrobacterales bacterium]